MHLGSETRNIKSSRYAIMVMYNLNNLFSTFLLQIQHDKLRRKALLGPANTETGVVPQSRTPENHQQRMRHNGGASGVPTNNDMAIVGLEGSGVWPEPLSSKPSNKDPTKT